MSLVKYIWHTGFLWPGPLVWNSLPDILHDQTFAERALIACLQRICF